MKGKKPACILLLTILILGVATVNVAADPQPKIFVDPSTYTAARLGEVFMIDINISNVQNLVSFDFKLAYNTTLLDALDAVEGSFPQEPLLFQKVINDAEGYVWVVASCGITSGNGTLAKIIFKATFPLSASCPLDLHEVSLYDDNGDPIITDVEDGNYNFVVLNITVETDKTLYIQGETVETNGNLTLEGSPVQGLVALEMRNPLQTTVFRTIQAGTDPPPGDVTIVDVVPCNAFGEPKQSFRRDKLAHFNVTLRNNSTEWKYVTICVNAYDQDMIFLDVQALYNSSLAPGVTPHIIIASIYLPPWAYIGTGTVYVSVFTDWPKNGGVPYCPEKSATFQITDGTLGTGALETRSPEDTGNYSLTFRLPRFLIKLGNYTVYVSSSYPATATSALTINQTTFEVKLLGDVNGDNWVDTGDKILVGRALWSHLGDPNYDPNADVNEDGEIDTGDKILIGRHLWEYGW